MEINTQMMTARTATKLKQNTITKGMLINPAMIKITNDIQLQTQKTYIPPISSMTSKHHTSSTSEEGSTPDMPITSTLPSEDQETSDCSTEAQSMATAPPPSTKDAMESQILSLS
jgi:hypothetical protein